VKEPLLPAHIRELIESVADEVPAEKRAAVIAAGRHIYRGGFIDGAVAASCEEAARAGLIREVST